MLSLQVYSWSPFQPPLQLEQQPLLHTSPGSKSPSIISFSSKILLSNHINHAKISPTSKTSVDAKHLSPNLSSLERGEDIYYASPPIFTPKNLGFGLCHWWSLFANMCPIQSQKRQFRRKGGLLDPGKLMPQICLDPPDQGC